MYLFVFSKTVFVLANFSGLATLLIIMFIKLVYRYTLKLCKDASQMTIVIAYIRTLVAELHTYGNFKKNILNISFIQCTV